MQRFPGKNGLPKNLPRFMLASNLGNGLISAVSAHVAGLHVTHTHHENGHSLHHQSKPPQRAGQLSLPSLVLQSQRSGKTQLTFPVLFWVRLGTTGALVDQTLVSDFCLVGVPPQMTFANYESTFSKPRRYHEWTRAKLRIRAAKLHKGVCLQPEPHLKIRNRNCPTTTETSDYNWRSSTWKFPDYEWTENAATKPKLARQTTMTKPRSSWADSALRFLEDVCA